MPTNKICRLTTTTIVLAFVFSFSASVWAQGFTRGREYSGLDAVRRWNEIAIDASGLDHTPVTRGEKRVFGEQLGPARSSRAMAIVHIAIFDAVIAITGGYRSYSGIPPAPKNTSMQRRNRTGSA